jgi:hypothetical protein
VFPCIEVLVPMKIKILDTELCVKQSLA